MATVDPMTTEGPVVIMHSDFANADLVLPVEMVAQQPISMNDAMHEKIVSQGKGT